MTDNENNANILAHARELLFGNKQPREADYQNGVIDMVAHYFDTDYVGAVELIHTSKQTTTWSSDDDHFILVAFELIGPKTMEEAQKELMALLPRPEDKDNPVECWWIAMDERYDGSDNDSAEFVPDTGQAAWERYHIKRGTPDITRKPAHEVFHSKEESKRRDRIMLSQANALKQIMDVTFDTPEEGRAVLDRMNHMVRTYGYVTVADLADLVGLSELVDYSMNKLAWARELPEACVRPIKFQRGCRLEFPTPDSLTTH